MDLINRQVHREGVRISTFYDGLKGSHFIDEMERKVEMIRKESKQRDFK